MDGCEPNGSGVGSSGGVAGSIGVVWIIGWDGSAGWDELKGWVLGATLKSAASVFGIGALKSTGGVGGEIEKSYGE